ncbi:Isoquinoline 1-oxidoreductase subunit [Hyalangium gracile]|uniref:Isoquinoline 1-oxidoreductase subunit n=1 Tax=Hyalangium gracile TaxID=394092 RepID=UPI001CCE6D53|nr:Isoquinoline 1-oxidoreductase subunit [Hyalangium gracile]
MRPSLLLGTSVVVLVAAVSCSRRPSEPIGRLSDVLSPVAPNELRSPEAFAVIADPSERSKALFLEASRVLLHPRCANCHPDGDSPYQGAGADWKPHYPPVTRGPQDKGVVGMECTSCHQDRNVELARVPGAPNWHLAPREMAWVGRTPRAVCEQMKDKSRNGGKTLAQIVEHNAHDELVGWGWRPGAGREPAPGTQERFGAIVAAWVETGAECPSEEARP